MTRREQGVWPLARESEPPPCGHCAGSGKVTYQRPRRAEDGTVTWVDSVENCHVCDGTGRCR
ncbi:hypothetical protein LO762_24605 [Actinocorallia sp. API 0066]|uniref:hypothetical protein n=1 Tax=Actinocorallia sp. API 0066 TaxID=2896846 RepID=UPI001E54BB43|nr:hypothetical protein [Actinocorallia sp. API 0066]MCD0452347.1 hypothetical protein [Actinocorallia sp. API 0066]